MAYSQPSTQVTGYVVLATNWNEFVNNFIAMAPDLFTADGEIHVATAANVGKALLAFTADLLLMELGAWELDISALTTDDGVGGASAGVAEIKVPMTQGEAEAGTGTRFSFVSPQRIKQAIDSLSGVTQASQAEAEAESNENKYVPPDLLRHSPGMPKIWVQWEQTGAHGLITHHNLTSVTDGGGAGITDHLWNTDFSGSDYALVGSADNANTVHTQATSLATTGAQTVTVNIGTGSAADAESNLVGFGDQ